MTGYELSRNWFDWCFENPDLHTCTHTAMYLWICEKWNRLGQKEKFGLPTTDTMEVLSIKSKTTYHKVFADLVEWGFIKMIAEAKNQNQSRVISLCQKMVQHTDSTRTALDTATIQQENSIGYGTVPIDKPINKEPKKPITSKQGDRSEIIYPFDSKKFKSVWANWNLYRKEKKCSYKGLISEQSALKGLSNFDEEFAIKLIEKSMSNGWQGLIFEKTQQEYEQYRKNNNTKFGASIADLIGNRNYND